MNTNYISRTTRAAGPQSRRVRTMLGAALLSGGLALGALGLAATASAHPLGSGPLPEPCAAGCGQGLILTAPSCTNGCVGGLIVFDFTPFTDGPLPEPSSGESRG